MVNSMSATLVYDMHVYVSSTSTCVHTRTGSPQREREREREIVSDDSAFAQMTDENTSLREQFSILQQRGFVGSEDENLVRG